MTTTTTQVLILRTDGTHELKRLRVDHEALGREIQCDMVERLVCAQGYTEPPSKTRRHLTCWVDEEGVCKQRPLNPYAPLLHALGLQLSFGYAVYGNAVLYSTDRGLCKKLDVAPYVVDLVKRYSECDDEDGFLCQLSSLQ